VTFTVNANPAPLQDKKLSPSQKGKFYRFQLDEDPYLLDKSDKLTDDKEKKTLQVVLKKDVEGEEDG